jgi:hypothetical protein
MLYLILGLTLIFIVLAAYGVIAYNCYIRMPQKRREAEAKAEAERHKT